MRLSFAIQVLSNACIFCVFLQLLLTTIEFRPFLLSKIGLAVAIRCFFSDDVRVSALDGGLLASSTQDARSTIKNASSLFRVGFFCCLVGTLNLCLATKTGIRMLFAHGVALELKKSFLLEVLASSSLSFSIASLDVKFPQNIQPAALLKDFRWIFGFMRSKKFRRLKKAI